MPSRAMESTLANTGSFAALQRQQRPAGLPLSCAWWNTASDSLLRPDLYRSARVRDHDLKATKPPNSAGYAFRLKRTPICQLALNRRAFLAKLLERATSASYGVASKTRSECHHRLRQYIRQRRRKMSHAPSAARAATVWSWQSAGLSTDSTCQCYLSATTFRRTAKVAGCCISMLL